MKNKKIYINIIVIILTIVLFFLFKDKFEVREDTEVIKVIEVKNKINEKDILETNNQKEKDFILENFTKVYTWSVTEHNTFDLDLDIKDVDGWTPLYHAVFWNKNIEITKLLLKAGADVNISDNDGWAPLHRAVVWNRKEIVELLLKYKADANISDGTGWTLLYRAVELEYIEIIKLLLKAGADVNIPDKKGIYPIDRAIEKKNIEMIELLIDNGAKIDLKKENKELYKKLLIKSRMGVMYDLLDIYK